MKFIRRSKGCYSGAGVLFVRGGAAHREVLLARRGRSGVWSIPGGGADGADASAFETAKRETIEEFGSFPRDGRLLFRQRFPFSFAGLDWSTWVIFLESPPPDADFPDRSATDFLREFNDAGWFPVRRPPPRTHLLLIPVLLRLRLADRLAGMLCGTPGDASGSGPETKPVANEDRPPSRGTFHNPNHPNTHPHETRGRI